ncbi:Dehydrogenase/reductase SDR family member 11 [Araneus ventricosus]|uniref:Dehydrogenase/reductase SDR family member 11 n=1 Tax=Araneus ventricosus TaxID=182803 RepID=A0A4Y2EW03_ARAVE|nr:Dehydrogenase/reductase SDR family member 11 [Araneus ventricosus]
MEGKDNFLSHIMVQLTEDYFTEIRVSPQSYTRLTMERWNGRIALVTGASVGIGAAICRALVQHGMVVVGCARNLDKIKAIAEEDAVKASPGRLVAIKCDVTQESEILSMFDQIRRTFGRLDICVNNAGLSHDAPLLTGNTEDWRNMLDVNVMALCICTQEAVKLMREIGIKDGQIIHISSIGGHRQSALGMPGLHFYSGTKFMVRALTEGLRRELKTLNSHIRIASLSPGMVETEFFGRYLKNDPTRNAADVFKSMKALEAKDIADSVLYILKTPPHVEVHDIILRPYDQAM